jgi:hypothetical protein
MNHLDLQRELASLGFYRGPMSGVFGPITRAALMHALTAGPDTPLTNEDVRRAAERINVTPAHIWTVWDVEASGNPFIGGRPTILFEPHRFARMTGGRFNESHPTVSYARWGARPYPRTQAERYDQLMLATSLDATAGLSAASYGGFQVLGENWRTLGYRNAFEFAYRQSLTVGHQMESFVKFLEVNSLAGHLRNNNWASFARGYNGTGFRENRYDEKLAARFAIRSRA